MADAPGVSKPEDTPPEAAFHSTERSEVEVVFPHVFATEWFPQVAGGDRGNPREEKVVASERAWRE
jgi:hypothetical protein